MTAFTWKNENFILHPDRVMFWEKEQTLIVSDLHIGKTGHFRKEGIAVPQKVYQEDLMRLFSNIQRFNPTEIIFTGDLFHSRINKEWDWFGRLRQDFEWLQCKLVLGNHDKVPAEKSEALGLQVTSILQKGSLLFVHNATDIPDDYDKNSGVICGHIHPAVVISSGIRQKLKLPCFHFAKDICTLPAFSLFTGNHVIKPLKTDTTFLISGNELLQF